MAEEGEDNLGVYTGVIRLRFRSGVAGVLGDGVVVGDADASVHGSCGGGGGGVVWDGVMPQERGRWTGRALARSAEESMADGMVNGSRVGTRCKRMGRRLCRVSRTVMCYSFFMRRFIA